MTVHPNSIQAYYTRVLPDLPRAMGAAYRALLDCGGKGTAEEIAQHVNEGGIHRGTSGNIHSKMISLEEVGVVRRNESRECTVTGNVAIEWEITGNTKQERKKRETKLTIALAENARLKKKVKKMRRDLKKSYDVCSGVALPVTQEHAKKLQEEYGFDLGDLFDLLGEDL